MAKQSGQFVRIHENRICREPECHDLIFKSASNKRVHDAAVHGKNTGMVVGSPRQRQFIIRKELNTLLEIIIMHGELNMHEIYDLIKLPASEIQSFLQRLVSQKIIKIEQDSNVENAKESPRRVCLIDPSLPSFK